MIKVKYHFQTINVSNKTFQIIRIVANIAINPDIGKLLNDNHGKQLIDEFLKVLISNPFKRNEELVLSVLSTLNNLSFYYAAEMDKDILHVKQIDIIQGKKKMFSISFFYAFHNFQQ